MFRRAALAGLVALAACQPAAPSPQLVSQWVRASINAAQAEQLSAPVAARANAYASVALYEGYAADPRSRLRSLAGQLNGLWSVPMVEPGHPVDGATVAAEAARVVLDSMFAAATTRATFDSLAGAHARVRRKSRVRDAMRERSVRHGRALAGVILAWSAADGFAATRKRVWRPAPGDSKWSPPPAGSPTEPHWGTLRTFVLRSGDECAPSPPPAWSSRPGSDFWKMGKELFDSTQALGDPQRVALRYWADSAPSAAHGAWWLLVQSQLAAQRRVTADRAVEMYLLASVAGGDVFVGSWREQFRSLVVRPVTFVNRVLDRRWSPALPTPATPGYPSSHAALASASAAVLGHFFGDSAAFTDSSQVAASAVARRFESFAQAADEAGVSRVYAGTDYLASITGGRAQGRCVGERVLGRLRTR